MSEGLSHIDNLSFKKPNTVNYTSDNDAAKTKVDNEQEACLEPRSIGVIFKRRTRYLIFLILVLTNLIINMDHGTIPAATSEIKEDLKIDDDTLGVFGSLVYFGNLLGAMVFFSIVGHYNRKWIIFICLVLILCCLYTFATFYNMYFLICNRILTGVFQSFISIYFPVWCDQFGPSGRKGLMIALLQLGVPLGVVLGYLLTAIIKNYYKWYFSLYIQCAGIILLTIFFMFLPRIYFSGKLQNQKRGSVLSRSAKSDDAISLYKESLDASTNNTSLFQNLKSLCRNYTFLFSILSISILFFIITAIQFWVSDYLKIVLKREEYTVNIIFIVTCITSPTLGIILGGFLATKTANSKSSSYLCVFLGLLAFGVSVPIPLTDNIYIFTSLLWLVLFFGAAIMPMLTYIIISSIPLNLRARGNSLSNFFANLIGYLPAPFVYGFINSQFKSYSNRLAITIVLYSSLLGVIFMAISCYFKEKNVDEKSLLLAKKLKEFKKTSDLSYHASLLATLWGNKNIDNELCALGEDEIEEESLGSKLSLYQESTSNKGSVILTDEKKQGSCNFIYQFKESKIGLDDISNTLEDKEYNKISFKNAVVNSNNKSI